MPEAVHVMTGIVLRLYAQVLSTFLVSQANDVRMRCTMLGMAQARWGHVA